MNFDFLDSFLHFYIRSKQIQPEVEQESQKTKNKDKNDNSNSSSSQGKSSIKILSKFNMRNGSSSSQNPADLINSLSK